MIDFIAEKRVCQNCLFPGHRMADCKSTYKCKKCGQKHHITIHDKFASTVNNARIPHFNKVLLATASVPVYSSTGEKIILKALIDQGSQVNLISESACQKLRLKKQKTNIPLMGIGGTNVGQLKALVDTAIGSIVDSNYHCALTALVMSKITQTHTIDGSGHEWQHLSGLALADVTYETPGKIDLLLGAEVYAEILMPGLVKGPSGSPMAQQTKLGWILSGLNSVPSAQSRIHYLSVSSFGLKSLGLFVNHNDVVLNNSLKTGAWTLSLDFL